MTIRVKKASGEIEPFSENKVKQSLKRAGAKPEVINKILAQLIGQLYDGITTKKIYAQVFELLNQYQAGQGYRYSLKPALMKLGPSGYPFEKFIARLLDHLGYQTKTQVIVSGKCIDHEIDVSAMKDNQHFLVECKFHNRPGTKSLSKDTLYTQARFEDIVLAYKTNPEHATKFHQPWLVTNTKLTTNAIKYGNCVGMKLIAWRYPQKGSLEELIEQNHLHPLTCLSFLDRHDCQLLFQNDLVLCQDLSKVKDKKLVSIGLSSDKVKQIKTALTNLNLHPNP
jgi:Holliday junction resolvase